MKKRALSLLLMVSMMMSMFAPAMAVEGETKLDVIQFSVETITVDGQYLLEPTPVILQAEDTVYTILERVAKEHNLSIKKDGTMVKAIWTTTAAPNAPENDTGDYGVDSGWTVSVNTIAAGSNMPVPPAPKAGDVVRWHYTTKDLNYDVLLMDEIKLAHGILSTGQTTLTSNSDDPFEEGATKGDLQSKYNKLKTAVEELNVKLTAIDADILENTPCGYLQDKTLWGGNNSELEIVKHLGKTTTAATAGQTLATGATITIEGTPTTYVVGNTYRASAVISPENATDKSYQWKISEILGAATIDQDGNFTITKEGTFQVQLWHKDKPENFLAQQVIIGKSKSEATKADITALLESLSKKLTENLGLTKPNDWNFSNLIAAGKAVPKEAATNYINKTMKTLHTLTKGTDLNRVAIVFTALGLDVTDLTGADGAPLNLIEKTTTGREIDGTNGAAYALIAYDSGPYDDVGTWTRGKIIEYLQSKQGTDGGWALSGEIGDTDITAMVVTALAPYYLAQIDTYGVTDTVDKAMALLKKRQNDTGAMNSVSSWGTSVNSNTTAMTILALTSLGKNPATDGDFIKNGKTLLDGILQFKTSDGQLAFTGNSTANGMANDQGYRALTAYQKVEATKKAFNSYDFSEQNTLPEQKISTNLRIEGITENKHNNNEELTFETSFVTVKDLLIKAVAAENITITEGSYGAYVTMLYGETANHFGQDFDGWTYRVNGKAPQVGIGDYRLLPGDKVEFFYGGMGMLHLNTPEILYHDGGAVITFTAPVTTYDENYTPTTTTQPVAGMTVVWQYEETSATYTTDAKGQITIPVDHAQGGRHLVAVTKTQTVDKKGEMPLVARLPADYAIKLENQQIVTADTEVAVTADSPYTIFTVQEGKKVTLKGTAQKYVQGAAAYAWASMPQASAKVATAKGQLGFELIKQPIYNNVNVDWDGKFDLPHLDNQGKSITTDYTVKFGTGQGQLEMGSGVRLLLPGIGSNKVGYIDKKGAVQPILPLTTDAKPSNGQLYGYINIGDKTAVWAKADAPIVVYTGGDGGGETPQFKVNFTLIGDSAHGTGPHISAPTWISRRAITAQEGATVKDIFEKALSDANIPHESNGEYVSAINGLAEFDNGNKSGWVYTVNGVKINQGYSVHVLSNGDNVVWKYIDTYTDEDTGGTTPGDKPSQPLKPTFPDVAADHWAKESIDFVVEKKLMNGTDKGFTPNEATSRAMIATVLFRYSGQKAKSTDGSFTDVQPGQWYTEACLWITENQIAQGYAGSFSPNGEVTREQLAVMIYNFAKVLGKDIGLKGDLSTFTDPMAVSNWATDAMKYAVKTGIITGKEGNLDPQGKATRAEVAVMMQRMDKLFQ